MAHFEIKHLYTVIQPFWAISTAVCTVKASKKNLQLRLRHSHNHKPTVYVQPIPVTVRHAPLNILDGVSLVSLEFWQMSKGMRLYWMASCLTRVSTITLYQQIKVFSPMPLTLRSSGNNLNFHPSLRLPVKLHGLWPIKTFAPKPWNMMVIVSGLVWMAYNPIQTRWWGMCQCALLLFWFVN